MIFESPTIIIFPHTECTYTICVTICVYDFHRRLSDSDYETILTALLVMVAFVGHGFLTSTNSSSEFPLKRSVLRPFIFLCFAIFLGALSFSVLLQGSLRCKRLPLVFFNGIRDHAIRLPQSSAYYPICCCLTDIHLILPFTIRVRSLFYHHVEYNLVSHRQASTPHLPFASRFYVSSTTQRFVSSYWFLCVRLWRFLLFSPYYSYTEWCFYSLLNSALNLNCLQSVFGKYLNSLIWLLVELLSKKYKNVIRAWN